MTRARKLWATICIAAAAMAAVAIWTGSRTSSIYAGAAVEQARDIREKESLLRSFEHQVTSLRAALGETTLYSVAIVVLLLIAVALLWSDGSEREPQAGESEGSED